MTTFRGTGKADKFHGSGKADTAYGFGGNDKLDGAKGNDHLEGGIGNDKLDGGTGDDLLVGHGYDAKFQNGDPVNRVATTGSDNDFLGGGAGNDTLLDYWGNNKLDGGDGRDVLRGGFGDDLIIGGRGDDYLSGGMGKNSYWGGMGNDTVDLADPAWQSGGAIDGANGPDGNGGPWHDYQNTIVFEHNLGPAGDDVVLGFDGGYNKLEFHGYKFADMTSSIDETSHVAEFHFQDGSDITVMFNDQLTLSDFMFV
jgi:hypothetical protein